MKKILLIIVFLITHFSFSQGDKSVATENTLIGKWCGIDYVGKSGCTIYDEKGFVTFISKESTFGGENYEYNGKNYIYKYEVNYSNSPILLDYIIFMKGNDKEAKHFRSIVRFLDKNTIEIKTGEKKYPKKFSSKIDKASIVLKRIE